MKPRKSPRLIPNRPHYIQIQVSVDGEETLTDWRIPSVAKCAKVLQMLQRSGIMEAYQRSGDSGDALVAELSDRLPLLFACQGALVGLCWANRSVDLDTDRKLYRTLEEYGEEVFEELHEAGWQLEQIQNIWIDLVGRLVDAFISQKEIQDKADFLPRATG